MKILVIGGTSFVGRAIVNAGLAAGHDMTVLNRGQTPTDLPSSVTRLVGDRHGDMSALRDHTFDATIDAIAYQRRDVESLAEALGGRGGHYLQISSVSAYQEPATTRADESTPLLELRDTDPNAEVGFGTYGVLKAECERTALRLFGDASAIVRPTYVIGSHDKTMRFPYWVHRIKQGGTIAFPGPRESALQWIDARDLGEFVIHLSASQFAGAVHACTPAGGLAFGDLLEEIARCVAPSGTTLVEIEPSRLEGSPLAGKFPLWSGGFSPNVLALDNASALSLGLSTRPLADSIADTEAWLGSQSVPAHWLSHTDEMALLSAQD